MVKVKEEKERESVYSPDYYKTEHVRIQKFSVDIERKLRGELRCPRYTDV